MAVSERGPPAAPPIVRSPTYPCRSFKMFSTAARALSISFVVSLRSAVRMIIGADGTAREIVVERGIDSGLDRNAVEAVRHWRFQPATRNGRPVAVKAAIAVNYRLL